MRCTPVPSPADRRAQAPDPLKTEGLLSVGVGISSRIPKGPQPNTGTHSQNLLPTLLHKVWQQPSLPVERQPLPSQVDHPQITTWPKSRHGHIRQVAARCQCPLTTYMCSWGLWCVRPPHAHPCTHAAQGQIFTRGLPFACSSSSLQLHHRACFRGEARLTARQGRERLSRACT